MSEEKGQLDIFYEKLNDQDFKQKVGMYLAFIMEFYRVLMGSFLLVFVPQKCGDNICGMFENVVTENPVTNTAFAGNILMFALFLCMYYCELSRENKMINYLHVNPELPRDDEAVGEILVKLPEHKRNSIWKLDKMYQTSGRVAIVGFVLNLGFSSYVVFSHYLDNKTVTVFLTNALFMGMKLYDIKSITETDKNIFLSAYLTRKIQYNDVDPDKVEHNDDFISSDVVLSIVANKEASTNNLLEVGIEEKTEEKEVEDSKVEEMVDLEAGESVAIENEEKKEEEVKE
jgi:hypothetical protein